MSDAAAPAAAVPLAVRPKPWMALAIVFVVGLALDQGTKVWARHVLPVSPAGCEVPEALVARTCGGLPVPFIEIGGAHWEWQLAMNLGSAFSMFAGASGGRWLLTIVGIAALFGIGYMARKAEPHQRLLLWGLSLIASGAVGNLIDRIAFGGVTDMVLWRYEDNRWPIFNIADVALVVGVGLLLISSYKEPTAEDRAKAEAKKAKRLAARR